MIVTCKTTECGYNENGWCKKKLIKINEQAQCAHVWKNGHPLSDWQAAIDEELKEIMIMEDVNWYEYDSGCTDEDDSGVTEPCDGEYEETRSDDSEDVGDNPDTERED